MADASTQLTISVKPGWKRGIKVTFPGEGDEGPGALPADVVLIVAERSVFPLFFGLGARNADIERVQHHTFFAALLLQSAWKHTLYPRLDAIARKVGGRERLFISRVRRMTVLSADGAQQV